jgi:hypothetical protein
MRGHRDILIGAGVILLTIGIYLPALNSLMVADDFLIVGRLNFGDAVRSLHDTVGYGRNEYRPVIAFSYALSNSLWRGASRGYHFDSVLLHALNAALLYSLLLLLSRSAAISGVAAVLFAVHPIHHERVVWITARDSLFSTLFTLLALIAYTLARRRNEGESTPSPRSVKILIGVSVGFFILGLLSYEGAVVLPGIMAAMEFFLFAQPAQGIWRRLRMAAIKTRWHVIVLFIYLAWWVILFHGKTGQYNLSYTAGNLFHNYYSLLYRLFYGNAHLAGALYFVLLVAAILLPPDNRPLALFSLLFMFLAFLPFVLTTGFADRFAYASAAGYAAFVALTIYTWATLGRLPALRLIGRPLAVLAFIILTGYYVVGLRARIFDWEKAGRIADSIPRQIKALHPDLPDGAKLVLARIPRMYGHAYVYPTGLESSIERLYPGHNLRVIYGAGEMKGIVEETKPGGPDTFYFQYFADGRSLEEIVSLQK